MTLSLEPDPEKWLRLQRVDSTNSYGLREALPSGSVIVADVQTSGRGRHGRSWVSLEDSLILTGVLIFSADLVADERLSYLPILAGVAVLRAAQAASPHSEFRIKEPNDVLVIRNGHPGKVAGILVESEIRGDSRKVVVGVGVNGSRAPEVSESIYQPMPLFDNAPFDRTHFAVSMIQEFNARFSQILGSAPPAFLGEAKEYQQVV
ncbi:MAG: biotin--[acetyl-CoA-carboxylase] ligase [Spirochaetia bacterium]|nr:biotin--[acetyl-CoA-carboxylase] ligase [Spirochaetia bacterium]